MSVPRDDGVSAAGDGGFNNTVVVRILTDHANPDVRLEDREAHPSQQSLCFVEGPVGELELLPQHLGVAYRGTSVSRPSAASSIFARENSNGTYSPRAQGAAKSR